MKKTIGTSYGHFRKETPIYECAEMVRAFLNKQHPKVQLRRPVTPQLPLWAAGSYTLLDALWYPTSPTGKIGLGTPTRCVYGEPGDMLWVRETWAAIHTYKDWETGYIDDWEGSEKVPSSSENGYWSPVYRATSDWGDTEERGFKWRSPTSMPYWASRIQLSIVDVRIQRAEDMSVVDIIAEGIPQTAAEAAKVGFCYWDELSEQSEQEWDNQTFLEYYGKYWDLHHGKKYPWNTNPAMYVITVKRIEPFLSENFGELQL